MATNKDLTEMLFILKGRVDTLTEMLASLQNARVMPATPDVSAQAKPPAPEEMFLPDIVRKALMHSVAGRGQRDRMAAWQKAERAWAEAIRGGGDTEEYAKRLASEVASGDSASFIDTDGVLAI